MRKIGITGGVGAGKSIILDYLRTHCHCMVLQADELAWKLEEPDGPCYQPLIDLLGEGILGDDQKIDHGKMSAAIFGRADLLSAVNDIVHPLVKREAGKIAAQAEADGFDFFFFEAALLIESTCDEIVDEVWYVYAPRKERMKRLMRDRGYTREKVCAIMAGQLSEKAFRTRADRVITNDGDTGKVYRQLDKWLT